MFDFELNTNLINLIAKKKEVFYAPRDIPQFLVSDINCWQNIGKYSSHAIWKGERCKNRLLNMPIDVDIRELIVGCPLFNNPILENDISNDNIPVFPGGDNGHTNPDYEKLLFQGIGGITKEIDDYINSSDASNKDFYLSCKTALEGLEAYISNTSVECKKKQMNDMADLCDSIKYDAPNSFHSAVQLLFFLITALWYGEDHVLVNLCRLDRILYRFYKHDIDAGIITPYNAFEIISHLYLQINNICPPNLAVASVVGGSDPNGNYFVNELSYIVIDAKIKTALVYPTIGVAWNQNIPDNFMNYSVRAICRGGGDPAIFNDSLIQSGLIEYGVSKQDAINWMNSTCVEIKVIANSNIWVAHPYYNCSQFLLDAMKDIHDLKIDVPHTIEDLIFLVKTRIRFAVEKAAVDINNTWNARKILGLEPLLSILTNDCLKSGLDCDNGGARYNWVENSFVGTANLADALYAIKKLVFDDKYISMLDYYLALERNYDGFEYLRQLILGLPKYGNDIDAVDEIACELFDFEIEISNNCNIGDHSYVPGTFCWVMHGILGRDTIATADGRLAGDAFADGAGSAQGRDIKGPTSSILSTTKWNHQNMIGGLVQNIKFSKNNIKTDSDINSIKSLIEAYMLRGGFEIQVNITDAQELKDAQINPDKHRDLIVRIAGYSDYFVGLSKDMQNEVITRTEHNI